MPKPYDFIALAGATETVLETSTEQHQILANRITVESESPEHLCLSLRFDDFDAFTESATGWNLGFDQLDRGAFDGEMTQVISGPVRLSRCRFNRKLRQLGSPPPGHWTFGIPIEPGMHYRWRGRKVEDHQVIGFDSDTELDSISERGFHLFAVSLSRQAAARLAEENGLRPLEETVGRRGVANCPPRLIQALRRAGTSIVSAARHDPNCFSAPAFQSKLQVSLPALMIEAFNRADSSASRPAPHVRRQALKRALTVIGDRAHEPVSTAELYQLSGASGRTLRYAFEDSFGLSPKAYLQAHRLNQVRRELRRADPSASGVISDIANAWGFWHLGEFAKDYRRMFGELPSATLKQCA